MGMNAVTGRKLTGKEHLEQSIRDILATPIGTRVMRRTYGSRLPDLRDAPMTPGLNVEIFAAVAEALNAWEPRFKLARVQVVAAEPGHLTLTLNGTYLPNGKPLTMEGVEIK